MMLWLILLVSLCALGVDLALWKKSQITVTPTVVVNETTRIAPIVIVHAPADDAITFRIPRDETVLIAARSAVARWEPVEVSGDYKRYRVYADLQKQFPTHAKRALAFAIEVALADAFL